MELEFSTKRETYKCVEIKQHSHIISAKTNQLREVREYFNVKQNKTQHANVHQLHLKTGLRRKFIIWNYLEGEINNLNFKIKKLGQDKQT